MRLEPMTLPSAEEVVILDYSPEHHDAFRNLNLAWIEEYFSVEAADREQHDDPESSLLADGGAILVAQQGQQTVGVGALRYESPGCFEVTKMAVDSTLRYGGVGRKVLLALLDRARALEAEEVFLICNTSLAPAIHLYRSVGFSEIPLRGAKQYDRGNIAFGLQLDS